MLRTKSLYSLIDRRNDGLRILTTRFRGRGMPTNRYDVWMPSLGPSERLLLKGTDTWAQDAREYKKELLMDGPIDSRVQLKELLNTAEAYANGDKDLEQLGRAVRRLSSTAGRADAA